MFATFMLQSLISTPCFALRPFTAAFIVALFAQYSTYIPSGPDWLNTPGVFSLFLILAVLEIALPKLIGQKLLLEIDRGWKVVVSFIATFAVIDPKSAAFLEVLAGSSSVLTFAWPFLTSGTTLIFANVRYSIYKDIIDVDEDDDSGLLSMLSWGEDFLAIFGTTAVIIFPAISIIIFLTTILGLFIVQRSMERLSEKNKVPCVQCHEDIHASAPFCHACTHQQPEPRKVGIFGQAKTKAVVDLTTHRYELVSRHRCPVCATRFQEKAIQQRCTACGVVTFKESKHVDGYLAYLHAKFPRTLLICFGVGLIPFLGIIPGVIYYSLTLNSGLRRYVPGRTGCVTRWIVRLLNLILITVQWIPIVGALILPAMCAISYFVYKKTLERERQFIKKLPEHQAIGTND